jgi:hypothetical protein
MNHGQSRFGGFNHGIVPTIACVNEATTPLRVELDELIAAMQEYVDKHVAPVWGMPARLVKSKSFIKGAWGLVFLDDSDHADTLGYHDLTDEGLPLAKVFVRTTLKSGEKISVCASHELVEMLVDPAINLLVTGPDRKSVYAYESADPVEELSFNVNNLPMSDFVYPSYFEAFRKPNSVQFDQLKKLKKPFEIHSGGYLSVFQNGRWKQIFATQAKENRFAREDRRGHRSEARKKEGLEPSGKPRRPRAARSHKGGV